MSIDNLYPYAGDHAVQNTLFILEWSEPLSGDALAQVNKLATKFRNLGLGELTQAPLFAIKFEHDGPHVDNNQVGGVSFSKKSPMEGPSRTVTVSRSNCVIGVPDYTRWTDVFADIQNYLQIVLELVAPMRALSAIVLQYTDVFTWRDDPKELRLVELFVKDKFLPSNIFQREGVWHIHQGSMTKCDAPEYSRLDNVNVDVIDLSGERTIQITGAHKAILDKPLWQSHLKNKEVVISILSNLHQQNKETIKDLLMPEVCAKIGLI